MAQSDTASQQQANTKLLSKLTIGSIMQRKNQEHHAIVNLNCSIQPKEVEEPYNHMSSICHQAVCL